MTQAVAERLDSLSRSDPAVAPLALLHLEVLRDTGAATWAEAATGLDLTRAEENTPYLHGQTFHIEPKSAQSLLLRLTGAARDAGSPLRVALTSPAGPDPLSLLEASMVADAARLEEMAVGAGVELALLATVGHIATLPLLRACGRAAEPAVEERAWHHGYCPVCAAWPTLAEMRGLERRRWLRCGRCGAGWRYRGQQCPFCRNGDHRALGYFAPEQARESQQASTCDQCHSYLKTITTISPLSPEDLVMKDLTTLELDLTALEGGYARPADLGFPLQLRLLPAQKRGGWFSWR